MNVNTKNQISKSTKSKTWEKCNITKDYSLKIWVSFSGQKVFCWSCSTCRCNSNVFVGRKFISQSCSSAIFPLLYFQLFEEHPYYFPQQPHQFTFPLIVYECSFFSTSSLTFAIFLHHFLNSRDSILRHFDKFKRLFT